MEVTELVVNNIPIALDGGKPTGLENIKVSLDRDFTYSGIDTKIDIDLKFWCESGKTELDAEYESKGVEGSGYVEITDVCGSNAKTTRFKLDFKKFKAFSNYSTLGLLQLDEINNDFVNWKDDLDREVNLTTILGQPEDFYIRNLPLRYGYSATSFESKESIESPKKIIDINQPAGVSPKPDKICYIYPKSNTTLNELETGYTLLAESLNVEQDTGLNQISAEYEDVNGNIITPPSSFYKAIPSIEPQAIFTNELEDGEVTLTTIGDTEFFIDFMGSLPNIRMNLYEYKEIIGIGTSFDKMRGYVNQLNNISLQLATVPNSILYQHPTISTKTFTRTFKIKKGESIWVWYQLLQGQYLTSVGTYRMIFDKYQTTINRSIDIEFILDKNVKVPIVNASEIEESHTKTKAYPAIYALNEIFKTNTNIAYTNCFSDLWFSRGDFIRGKINVADFIVKPSDFFRELEKIVCCGLGVFYDNLGNAQKELKSVFDFYSDTLVETFVESDIIDGELTIEPFPSVFYKDISIGYSNSKDSPNELCKQNDYSIDNNSNTRYSKVSDFIASQYIITNALRLGTVDDKLEFDDNIFILSGTTVSAGPSTNYNVTLSQTSGFLGDNVIVNGMAIPGVNKRYATVLNLFRHLYKWGFSLFASKEVLTVNKYKGSTIYNGNIITTAGTAYPYGTPYQSLNECKLPRANPVKIHQTVGGFGSVNTDYEIYVPSVITFKTTKYSSISLLAMRENQYDLFSVSDGTNIYYGNLISANLEDDVTEIKLLRRFKDGL
jgi:hypothetical protein